MGETVQLYGGIYEVNFGYNVKKEVYPNSSFDIPKLYDISPASKNLIFEGFSWQRENFLNNCMYILIMMHKEVGI
jgi:hypothetical protein